MTAADAAPRAFADVTALRPMAPGGFAADLDPDWTVAGKPNGGYLAAILARAATAVCESDGHRHVLAASTHFCRSPSPGPATVALDVLHRGRSVTRVRAGLSQDGRLCADAVFTVGTLADADGARPDWDAGAPLRSTVGFDEATVFRPPPELLQVGMMDQVQLRMEPASLGFATAGPSGRGELRGWLALPGGERFDTVSLQLAVDAMPPATFDIEFTGWMPTLQLTTYVRAVPAPGPVQLLHRAHLLRDEHVDETCHVWDSAGRLVAHSTQLAGIRRVGRA